MSTTEATGAAPRPLRRGLYFHLSRTRLFIIFLVLLAPCIVMLVRAGTRAHPRAAAQEKTPAISRASTRPSPVIQPSPVGPWGELEVTPITIEAPADAAVRFARVDTSTWYFANCSAEKLSGVLKTAGLSDTQRLAVLRSASANAGGNDMVFKPDPALIADLSYEVRTALYQVLAEDSRNSQAEPFRRRPDPANDWFADIGLNNEAASLARRLVYRRGDLEAFADVSVIVPALHTDAERGKMFQALSSQSALVVRLRIGPQSDLNGLLDYWGRGDRQREIAPLLESLAKVPGGDVINIAQLLPQFARARLYTYPDPIGSSPNGPLDCHWTSLNFWNASPDNRFSNAGFVAEQLGSAYHKVDKPAQLGDVIFFIDNKGQGIHSATYIADDIVFTKNGTSVASPWVLMRLPSLLSYYENIDAVKTLVFRKNDF